MSARAPSPTVDTRTSGARAHSSLSTLLVAIGLLAGALALPGSLFATPAQTTAARCAPRRGHVLARSPSVVAWRTGTGDHEGMEVCLLTSGIARRVPHANSSIFDVAAAGDYLGFDYGSGGPTVTLDVFDAFTGHTTLRSPIGRYTVPNTSGPGGSEDNEQPGCVPAWKLSASGLIGEIEPCSPTGPGEPFNTGPLAGLTIRSPGRTITDLDTGLLEVAEVGFEGTSTITWSFAGVPRYSAPLGAALDALAAGNVPPPAPIPAACALVTPADVQPLLGAVTTSSPGGVCTYANAAADGNTVTVTVQASLTPAQVRGGKERIHHEETAAGDQPGTPNYGAYTWSAVWETFVGSVEHYRAVRFVGDVELTVELVAPDPEGGQLTIGPEIMDGRYVLFQHPETIVPHLADIAFDRLMGWPVQYDQHG